MIERTLSIIKPDAVKAGNSGLIIARLEKEGFKIVAQKRIKLSRKQVQLFYREHIQKPFFKDLTDYMVSGPIIAQVLEKENAVVDYRTLIGATDSREADEGTIRREFGKDKTENAVHGSDNIESANREIHFFFSDVEITNEEKDLGMF